MKTCAVCGDPVPKGRSKYCSQLCSDAVYSHNVADDRFRPLTDEDRALLAEAAAPVAYVGAWLEADDLRARNRELEPYGRRICRTHQGAALPLTEEHFHRTGWGNGFRHVCKKCKNARSAERAKERYQSDSEFRERRAEFEKEDRQKHIVARRAANQKRQQRYRLRQKRARLAAVLGQP